MKTFIHENFMLENKTAEKLYHEYAKSMPIIDFHTHLPPDEIASDKQFESLAEIWLGGDHYKWRAMRTNGVPEKYCTGNVKDFEKFMKWAETVPHTMRNPLYHWTHMELKQSFGIDKLLNPDTAEEIYEEANNKLRQKDYSTLQLLKKWNVDTVCTTDDPVDDLKYHQKIRENDGIPVNVYPTWRPDQVLGIQNIDNFNAYIDKLEKASDVSINSYNQLITALRKRHDFFDSMGCKSSDHGIETFYDCEYTENEITGIFDNARSGKPIIQEQAKKYQMALLHELAVMNHEKGWVQQFHYGAMRNNNTRMYEKLGKDSGFDSIGDKPLAQAMSRFFDHLDVKDKLTKTIIYNINPNDNEMVASMFGNFQDGSVPGKMQMGPAWWFNDNIRGMEIQMDVLSNLGLLSRFVGMLTDSRSFLSFSRHDYFRRILCNMLGRDIEKGLLPEDYDFIGQMVMNICYHNAKGYFKF
ncbi:MAG: glucuronate isomerase [Bacteroidota bacterium]